MQCMTKAYTRLLAAAKKAAAGVGNPGGPLVGAYVGLATALDGAITPDQTWANVTECTFAGYARLALGALNGPYDDSEGLSVLLSAALKFAATDAVTPETAKFVFLVDGAGGTPTLLGLEALPGGGIPLINGNQGFEYVFRDGEDLAGSNALGSVVS